MSDSANPLPFPEVEMPAAAAKSHELAIRFLVGELARLGRFPAASVEDVVRAVLRRESLGSTGIGRGVALPHARSDAVNGVTGVFGRCPEAVPWPGAVDPEPVRTVCLMITPASDPAASLRALEAVFRQLKGGGPPA